MNSIILLITERIDSLSTQIHSRDLADFNTPITVSVFTYLLKLTFSLFEIII